MPAELVTADIEEPPPTLACAETPYLTVVDEVGVVSSCAGATSNNTVPPATDWVIVNPGGDTSALQVSWPGSQCTYEVHLLQTDLDPRGHYEIKLYETPSCSLLDLVHSVTLQLTKPIEANQILGTSVGGPPGTPSATPE